MPEGMSAEPELYSKEKAENEAQLMEEILEKVGALTSKKEKYRKHGEDERWVNLTDGETEYNDRQNIERNYELASMLVEKNAQVVLTKNESHEMYDKKNQVRMEIEDAEKKEYYNKGIHIIRHHVADYPGECQLVAYEDDYIDYPSRILTDSYQPGRDEFNDERKVKFDAFPEDIQQSIKDFYGYGNVDLAKKARLTRLETATKAGEISGAEREQLLQLEDEGRLVSCSFVSKQDASGKYLNFPQTGEKRPVGVQRTNVDVWATVEKPLESEERRSMGKVTKQTM